MEQILLPYKFEPRHYQANCLNAIEDGYRRGMFVWHRRAGKDKALLNVMIREMFSRVGNYYYYFPSMALGRKAVWDDIDSSGFSTIDHFPKAFIAKKNDNEMKITLKNGSTFQICGTDRLDVVGPGPCGVVMSEYAKCNPRAYILLMPILRENRGWFFANTTPRGKNHAWDMKLMAEDNEEWLYEELTVDDTGMVSEEDIEKERQSGMSEEMIQQEYYVSFEYGLEGSYFTQLMKAAKSEGRVGHIPHNISLGVETGWDIGLDATCIWFYQRNGIYTDFIDYYEMSNTGISHYITEINKKAIQNGYNYIRHFAPHDIKNRTWADAQTSTRINMASNLGIDFEYIPRILNKDDSIQAASNLISVARFDKVKCKDGINSLQNYQREWNEKYRVYSHLPQHNWASHGSDAFQTCAMACDINGGIGSRGTGMTAGQARALQKKFLPANVV